MIFYFSSSYSKSFKDILDFQKNKMLESVDNEAQVIYSWLPYGLESANEVNLAAGKSRFNIIN